MNKFSLVILSFLLSLSTGISQTVQDDISRILFHGLVMDSGTKTPLSNTQIFINHAFVSASDNEGKFAFYVITNDTVTFSRLGYKTTYFHVSDTLTGREFIAGIYMPPDTLSIGEVIIIPRLASLRSEMLSPLAPANTETEYAKYNLALSAYQGRVSQGKMGDPATNYSVLSQKQKMYAYSKGQIPSDQIVGISPLLLIPAAYLLINGLPEKPKPLQPRLTDQEISQIHKRYLETLKKKE